jgi:hypothetical protein
MCGIHIEFSLGLQKVFADRLNAGNLKWLQCILYGNNVDKTGQYHYRTSI